MRPLLGRKVKQKTPNGEMVIGFRQDGNKHIFSDTFGRAKGLKKKDLKNLDKALAKASYVKSAPITKERKDGIFKFYYFKDSRKRLYYNVAEIKRGKHISRYLYSVTDRLK